MIKSQRRLDLSLKHAKIQLIGERDLLLYSKGLEVIFYDLETNSEKTRESFEVDGSNILFFKLYDGGSLDGTLVVYLASGKLFIRNVQSKKENSYDFLAQPSSVDFDSENDFVIAKSDEEVRIFDVFRKTELEFASTEQSSKNEKIFKKYDKMKFLKNDLLFLYGELGGVIYNYRDQKTIGKPIETSFKITTVAFHQSNRLALGDEKGRITLITNLLSKRARTEAIYHWHSMAVGALRFTDGQTLISGGKEAVLVFWQESSNRKDFCPRLHGEITGIFLDESNEHIVLTYENNAIGVIKASNYRLVSLVKEIDFTTAGKPTTKVTIAKKGLCAMFGNSNTISLISQSGANATLSITQENITSRNNHHVEGGGPGLTVTAFAFTEKLDWAISAEYCEFEEGCEVNRVKFFSFDKTSKKFTLNTAESDPSSSKITVAEGFESVDGSKWFVTASSNGEVSFWSTFWKSSQEPEKWERRQSLNVNGANPIQVRIVDASICHLVFADKLVVLRKAENEWTQSHIIAVDVSKTGELRSLIVYEGRAPILISQNYIMRVSEDLTAFSSSQQITGIQSALYLASGICALVVYKGDVTLIVLINVKESIKIVSCFTTSNKISSLFFFNNLKANLYCTIADSESIYQLGLSKIDVLTDSELQEAERKKQDNLMVTESSKNNIRGLQDILSSLPRNGLNRNYDDGWMQDSHLIPNLKAVFDFKMNKLLG